MNKIILENLISKNKENDTQNNKTSIPEILNPIISSRLSNRNEMNEFIESNNPFSNQNNNNNKNNNNTNNKNNNKNTNNIFKNIEENLSESFNEKFPEAKKIKATLKRFYSYRRAFSKFKRKLIFTLILILNILINLDHGAIPAGTISLKLQNSLNNIKLGTIGSFTYLGLIFGSISAGYIYSNYSPKWILARLTAFTRSSKSPARRITDTQRMRFTHIRKSASFPQRILYLTIPRKRSPTLTRRTLLPVTAYGNASATAAL